MVLRSFKEDSKRIGMISKVFGRVPGWGRRGPGISVPLMNNSLNGGTEVSVLKLESRVEDA